MTNDWYLVQFKPNSHRIAERNLGRQGFVTFLPIHEITRRQSSRFVSELRPLFPGYMFIELDPSISPWRKVNSTQGVARIVSFGAGPAQVPKPLVEALLRRSDTTGRIRTGEDFAVGAPIRVIDGPFSEFVGTVEAMDADRRVWILLEFMGQTARIQVDGSQVVGQ